MGKIRDIIEPPYWAEKVNPETGLVHPQWIQFFQGITDNVGAMIRHPQYLIYYDSSGATETTYSTWQTLIYPTKSLLIIPRPGGGFQAQIGFKDIIYSTLSGKFYGKLKLEYWVLMICSATFVLADRLEIKLKLQQDAGSGFVDMAEASNNATRDANQNIGSVYMIYPIYLNYVTSLADRYEYRMQYWLDRDGVVNATREASATSFSIRFVPLQFGKYKV